MLRKYAKYSIIVLIQFIGLVTFALLMVPLMISHTGQFNQLHDVFTRFHDWFLLSHSLFYILMYCLWPRIIQFTIKYQTKAPSEQQIHKALCARYYIIGAFVIIEILNQLG